VTRTAFDLLVGSAVEQKGDFGVAERIQAPQRVGSNLRGVQFDRCSAASPIVIDGIGPAAPHIAYGFYRECHRHLRSVAVIATIGPRREVRITARLGTGGRRLRRSHWYRVLRIPGFPSLVSVALTRIAEALFQ
jgi:hypothetical protein